MDIVKQIEQIQANANKLAIEESNLSEQLRAIQARHDQVVRAKHQAFGALEVLKRLASEQPKPEPSKIADRRAAKGSK